MTNDDEKVEASLDERGPAAGADEVGRMVQDSPDHTWYIGKWRSCMWPAPTRTVVFDNELKPRQQFNLEAAGGRTALRWPLPRDHLGEDAHTLEGKAQVAPLRHPPPAAPPGSEAKIPNSAVALVLGSVVARRDAPSCVGSENERDLDDLAYDAVAPTHRSAVRRSAWPIVGYTNAGKSTLLNQLTNSGGAPVENESATLTPTTAARW